MANNKLNFFIDRHSFKTKLNRVISENYLSKDFSILKLAEIMKLNQRTLGRHCRKYLAQPPSKIIQTFKINKAKILIKEGLEAKVVAVRSGYHCKGAFLQALKKEIGHSPTSFLMFERSKLEKQNNEGVLITKEALQNWLSNWELRPNEGAKVLWIRETKMDDYLSGSQKIPKYIAAHIETFNNLSKPKAIKIIQARVYDQQ